MTTVTWRLENLPAEHTGPLVANADRAEFRVTARAFLDRETQGNTGRLVVTAIEGPVPERDAPAEPVLDATLEEVLAAADRLARATATIDVIDAKRAWRNLRARIGGPLDLHGALPARHDDDPGELRADDDFRRVNGQLMHVDEIPAHAELQMGDGEIPRDAVSRLHKRLGRAGIVLDCPTIRALLEAAEQEFDQAYDAGTVICCDCGTRAVASCDSAGHGLATLDELVESHANPGAVSTLARAGDAIVTSMLTAMTEKDVEPHVTEWRRLRNHYGPKDHA